MGFIRDFATSLCFAALSAAIVQMIMPSGSMEKTMKLVVGTFFLSCLLSPLLTSKGLSVISEELSLTSGSISTSRLQQEIDRQLEAKIEERIKELICQVLSEKGVKANKITVYMDRKEKNSISINKANIVLENCTPAEKEEVQKRIFETLGIMPKISITGTLGSVKIT